ncbi:intracellular growth attenuator family protein, partial [Salmonella enterica subsp. enterica serovar Kentucky]|nr:intracellular growth attenuator family protein [Salmonella enterica subsp. enterica serovar Kentucky]
LHITAWVTGFGGAQDPAAREGDFTVGAAANTQIVAKAPVVQINNISLGIIDLIYPAHWQPYITQDLGQQTDIDIYLDRHVAR